MSNTTSGAAGMATINARTQKELREKLDALLGELEGFEFHATIVVNKDGATKEDIDLLDKVLDKWQEQENNIKERRGEAARRNSGRKSHDGYPGPWLERGHGSGEQSARAGQTIEHDKEVLTMGKLDEEQELRVWLLKQRNNAMPLFEKWHWLKKGLKQNDLRLRKLCLKGDFGLFGSPQEMLEWIKNGTIPRCCRKAGGSGTHRKKEK